MKEKSKMKEIYSGSKGITMIALVITIIITLIIAGISVAQLNGENGILNRTKKSVKDDQIGREKEKIMVAFDSTWMEGKGEEVNNEVFEKELKENGLDSIVNQSGIIYVKESKRKYKVDEEGNINLVEDIYVNVDGVKIPNDFKHIEENKKEDGIVVEDVLGNQYVWVPVTKNEDGTPTKPYKETNGKLSETNPQEIQLKRTDYLKDGLFEKFTEDTEKSHKREYGNAIAKDLDGFKRSVDENGGYFIARYEMGVENGINTGKDILIGGWQTPEKNWTGYTGDNIKLVTKQGAQVWNYITQNKASELCKDITNANKYIYTTTDLINSYAWDTTIDFIQKCGGDENYAKQTGKAMNQSGIYKTGEAVLAEGAGYNKKDKRCNIYDMATNCFEWTTETYNEAGTPCGYRGGINAGGSYPGIRYPYHTILAHEIMTFRAIAYINI